MKFGDTHPKRRSYRKPFSYRVPAFRCFESRLYEWTTEGLEKREPTDCHGLVTLWRNNQFGGIEYLCQRHAGPVIERVLKGEKTDWRAVDPIA